MFLIVWKSGTKERSWRAPDGVQIVLLRYGFVTFFWAFTLTYGSKWFLVDGNISQRLKRSQLKVLYPESGAPGGIPTWDRWGFLVGIVVVFVGALAIGLMASVAGDSLRPR